MEIEQQVTDLFGDIPRSSSEWIDRPEATGLLSVKPRAAKRAFDLFDHLRAGKMRRIHEAFDQMLQREWHRLRDPRPQNGTSKSGFGKVALQS